MTVHTVAVVNCGLVINAYFKKIKGPWAWDASLSKVAAEVRDRCKFCKTSPKCRQLFFLYRSQADFAVFIIQDSARSRFQIDVNCTTYLPVAQPIYIIAQCLIAQCNVMAQRPFPPCQ